MQNRYVCMYVAHSSQPSVLLGWVKGMGRGGEGSRAIELLIIKMVSTKHLSNKGKNKLNQKTSYM